MERNNKPKISKILHILMAVCVLGIVISLSVLLSENREYIKGDAAYQQLRQIRTIQPNDTTSSHTVYETTGEAPETAADDTDAALSTQPIEETQEEIIAGIDFEYLSQINPDVVGWIYAEGTGIDYPAVQGRDNDYYLRRLFTGERNKLGSIFMDYRTSKDFSGKNTILYGHNMKDGSMFSSLTKYGNQNFYDKFPSMQLYTPAGDYEIELFAGFVVDGNYESVRFEFTDDNDFLSYIDTIRGESDFNSDINVSADDRIITLCTCSYEYDNARYTLFGKLTPVW